MTRRFPILTGLLRGAALCGTLVAVACASTAPKPTPPAQPAVSIPVQPPARPSSGNPVIDARLEQARGQALAQGSRPEVIDQATAGIAPIASIAASNAIQPEFAKQVWTYLDSAVSARRVKDAQLMLSRYGDVLARIENQSGVRKEILVAIWGMETDYGADSGGLPLFAALATLAYNGPRASYARPEINTTQHQNQKQHKPQNKKTTTKTGAFGQTQFTPTTFFKY